MIKIDRIIDRCVHCGETEEKHHEYEPIGAPVGCRCPVEDLMLLTEQPKPICEAHVGPDEEWCERCWHGKECHS